MEEWSLQSSKSMPPGSLLLVSSAMHSPHLKSSRGMRHNVCTTAASLGCNFWQVGQLSS